MFNTQQEELDITNYIEKSAEKFIIQDRSEYVPLFKKIEEYAYSNGLVFYGFDYLKLLNMDKSNRIKFIFDNEPFKVHSYSSNVSGTPIELRHETQTENVIELVKSTIVGTPLETKDVVCKSNLKVIHGKRISLDNRVILTITSYENFVGEIFNPIEVPGVFADKVLITAKEYNLIDIYKYLSTIEESYAIENTNTILKLLDIHQLTRVPKYIPKSGNIDLTKFYDILTDPDVIIIGSFGLLVKKVITQSEFNGVLTILTSNLNSIKHKLLSAYSKDLFIDSPKKSHSNSDYRLKEMVVRYRDRIILTVYNTLEFELVPFELIDNYKIGGIYTILKYLMIEYYSLEFKIKSFNKVLTNPKNEKLYYYFKALEFLKSIKKKNKIDVILYKNYLGVYYPEQIFTKRHNIIRRIKFLNN